MQHEPSGRSKAYTSRFRSRVLSFASIKLSQPSASCHTNISPGGEAEPSVRAVPLHTHISHGGNANPSVRAVPLHTNIPWLPSKSAAATCGSSSATVCTKWGTGFCTKTLPIVCPNPTGGWGDTPPPQAGPPQISMHHFRPTFY